MGSTVAENVTSLFLFIDLTGVFLAALLGAVAARRHPDIDITGVWGLALAAGVGGGLIRDILLQRGTPVALTDVRYLIVVIAAAACGFLYGDRGGVLRRWPILVVDALALGNFAVSSTLRTVDSDLGVLTALLLGVIGATGGGMLRDLLLGERPAIFVRGEFNALAALAASAVVLVGIEVGLHRVLASALGIAVGSTLRLLSLRFGWRSPGPR
ncbi:MAG: trimeric intracellular cation channel family protein [Chloroflexi bacterium]|nr:MAG: trimeric intracellular cation channel family protein [Chloroflexota bacterium]